MTSSSIPKLSEIVQTRFEFTGFVQLDKALDSNYRRNCRKAFLPTETENNIFRMVVRAARGALDQGRRNLLIVSPFGTGKSLDLVMIYDIFSSKGNKDAIHAFDQGLRNDLLALTSQGPYLVVPVVGIESPMPLSQAILKSFRYAIEEHPFLKDARASNPFLIQIEYEQAVQWLRKIKEGTLDHLAAPLDKFLRGHSSCHTRTSLEKALEDCDLEALETWRVGFKNVTGELPSGFGVATPRDVFDRALPVLQSQGIVGISLLIDELSQYLRLYPQYEVDAIRTLDPLIHWIHNSDTCFSIVATQVVPERLQGEGDADYQAWASMIQGRFQQIPMNRRQYDRLIAQALSRVENAQIDPDKHTQMQELYEAHLRCFVGRGDDRATAQKMVAKYYPFHPTGIAAIGAITDTLGQYERSIFQYLDRRTEGGFKDFTESHSVYLGPANDRLELVTLDEIFRYFAKTWSNVENVNDGLARASRRAEAAIQGDLLARRVLDLVTLLAFLENRASLPTPTIDGIALMLNVPVSQQLKDVLQRFIQEGYFLNDNILGYRLDAGIGPRPIEVDNAIQRQLTGDHEDVTGTVVLDYLKRYQQLAALLKRNVAPPFPIEESREVIVKNLKKTFRREFVTGRELVEKASALRSGNTLAGKLLVGTVTIIDNVDGKQYGEAIKAAKKLAEAGAIVALVRHPVNTCIKPIKHYKAAKAVADDVRLGTSEVARIRMEDALYQLLGTLSTEYQERNLDWYTPAAPTMAMRFDTVGAVVEVAAQKLTEKFPSCIAKPDVVGGTSRTEVISTLLSGGGPLELRGLPGRVYNEALVPLGVVAIEQKARGNPQQTVVLIAPNHTKPELTASAEIWSTIAQVLPIGASVEGEKIYEVLQSLQRPPYWCPENLIIYLLAAYLGMHRAEVKEPRDLSFRKPGIDDVRTLVNSRSSNLEVFIPRSTTLSRDQALFVKSLAEAVVSKLPAGATVYASGSFDASTPESVLAKISEDLGRWYRDYGAYALGLISDHSLAADTGRSFLIAVKDVSTDGPNRLGANSLYPPKLLNALRVPANQAPLIVEQTIEGLTELAKAREKIEKAALLKGSDRTVLEAWDKFARDCLNRDLRDNLLRVIKDAEDRIDAVRSNIGSITPPSPQSQPPIIEGDHLIPSDVATTTDKSQSSTNSMSQTGSAIPRTVPNIPPSPQSQPSLDGNDRPGPTNSVLTIDEIELFANFVLTIADQVKSGKRMIRSLEELIQVYRATQSASMLSHTGGNPV